MGKTYRRGDGKGYDEDRQDHRHGKHSRHPNNKKFGGMKVVNPVIDDEDDDYFCDVVTVKDLIRINKNGEEEI